MRLPALALAAIAFLATAGAADAACKTRDLAGEYAVTVGFSCGAGACAATCAGTFNTAGKMRTTDCVEIVAGERVTVEMTLKVIRGCRLTGSARYTSAAAPGANQQKLSGYLGTDALQFIGTARPAGSATGLGGSFGGIRIAK